MIVDEVAVAAAARDLWLEEEMVGETEIDAFGRRRFDVVVGKVQERHYHVSYFRILDDLLDVCILVLDDSLDG